MILIIDYQYFGNINYYKNLFNASHVILEQYENFQKTSFHNRCTIAGANGPIHLTVPIKGGRTRKSILKEVRISNRDNWQRSHWRSIVSSYNRSPWFEFYQDDLSVLYQQPFEFLKDWDEACLEWSLKVMKADLVLAPSQEYKLAYPEMENLDLRGKITPRNPGFPPGEKPESRLVYRQVFEDRNGFIPDLSILDLLFCEGGKNAFLKLKRT